MAMFTTHALGERAWLPVTTLTDYCCICFLMVKKLSGALLKETLIKLVGVAYGSCAIVPLALVLVILLPVGRVLVHLWLVPWVNALCGCVPYQVWPLNPVTCFRGRGRRSKVSRLPPFEVGEEGVLWAWLCGGGVAPPIEETRSAVV